MTANLALEQAGASTNKLKAGTLRAANHYPGLKSERCSPDWNIVARLGRPFGSKIRLALSQTLQINRVVACHTVPNRGKNMTTPRVLDEAATIDGANPLRILISIIIPNAWPVIVAVSLFHFFFAWNDFFEPLIYLSATPDLQPISVGMQAFNALYAQQPHLIQSTALLGMALPVILFFLAQKIFLQGASMAGVSK